MDTGFDIAIIGGGVIGLALARTLCSAAVRVVVIDAGTAIPAATNAAAGMLAPSFENDHDTSDALYAYCAQSLALWPDYAHELEDEIGMSVDYRDDGILGVALSESQWEALQAEYKSHAHRGANVEILSGDEARLLEPGLSSAVVGALYAPDDAQVDPRKLLLALRASFQKRGGFISDARVINVERGTSGYQIQLDAGALIEASTLVLASGAAAMSDIMSEILAALMPGQKAFPVHPAKGEAVALAMGDVSLRHVVRAPGAYICPKAGARMVIGATEYHHQDDLQIDPLAIEGLVRNGSQAVAAISAMKEIERWAGLRPATTDGAPILGCDPGGPTDLYLALGHHRNGILLAPATAKALSAEILGQTVGREAAALTLKPFNLSRFRGLERLSR